MNVRAESLDSLSLALLAEDVEADFFESVAGIEAGAAPPRGAVDESVTLFDVAGSHGRTLPKHPRRGSSPCRGFVGYAIKRPLPRR